MTSSRTITTSFSITSRYSASDCEMDSTGDSSLISTSSKIASKSSTDEPSNCDSFLMSRGGTSMEIFQILT